MPVKFNLNDQVKVKLTDVGIAAINTHFSDLRLAVPDKYIAGWDGCITLSVWEMMNIFGNYCYNGCQPPIQTEVEFK